MEIKRRLTLLQEGNLIMKDDLDLYYEEKFEFVVDYEFKEQVQVVNKSFLE